MTKWCLLLGSAYLFFLTRITTFVITDSNNSTASMNTAANNENEMTSGKLMPVQLQLEGVVLPWKDTLLL